MNPLLVLMWIVVAYAAVMAVTFLATSVAYETVRHMRERDARQAADGTPDRRTVPA